MEKCEKSKIWKSRPPTKKKDMKKNVLLCVFALE